MMARGWQVHPLLQLNGCLPSQAGTASIGDLPLNEAMFPHIRGTVGIISQGPAADLSSFASIHKNPIK